MQINELEQEIDILGSHYKKGEIYMFTDQPLVTVEANKNRDIITEQDARDIAASLPLRPISNDHKEGKMLGVYTDAKYVERTDKSSKPQVLASGIFYAKHTPKAVIEGLKNGEKSQSIEATADQAGCTVCGKWFNDQSEYCNHLQARNIYNAFRKFIGMRATGGGIVDEPAGSNTTINPQAVSILASKDEVIGREFSDDERKKLAKEGDARPDGSYPIVTVEDLHNAIRAWGRGGATEADKAHIIARAKSLGATKELPENWVKAGSAKKGQIMKHMHGDKAHSHDGGDAEHAHDNMQGSYSCDEADDTKAKELSDVKAQLATALTNITKKDEELTALKEQAEQLATDLKASKTEQRRMFLVGAGVFSEDEWTIQKDIVMAMDDKAIELFASKSKQPLKKPVMLQGGVQNTAPVTQVKPKLVFSK